KSGFGEYSFVEQLIGDGSGAIVGREFRRADRQHMIAGEQCALAISELRSSGVSISYRSHYAARMSRRLVIAGNSPIRAPWLAPNHDRHIVRLGECRAPTS